jgi:hypothetical protein
MSAVYKELRSRSGEIKLRLQTIHPNPGPGGRDKTDEGRRVRRGRRYKKREEKIRLKPNMRGENFINIITWNVQRMSRGTANKRKLKMVANYVSKNKWELVLLTEVRTVVWLGEGKILQQLYIQRRLGVVKGGPIM